MKKPFDIWITKRASHWTGPNCSGELVSVWSVAIRVPSLGSSWRWHDGKWKRKPTGTRLRIAVWDLLREAVREHEARLKHEQECLNTLLAVSIADIGA